MTARPLKHLIRSVGLAAALGAAALLRGAWGDPGQGRPLMINQDLADAGTTGPVWAFSDGGDGSLFLGADQVAWLKGESWRALSLPKGSAVRGLARDGNRVYLGAAGELGYLEKSTAGDWQYVSLTTELAAEGLATPAAVWDVRRSAEGIVFVAADRILRYRPKAESAGPRFESWPVETGHRPMTLPMSDELWLSEPGVGLVRMEKAGPQLIWPEKALPDSPVVWALPAEAPSGDGVEGMLIGTSSAVYVRTSGAWAKLEGLSAQLKGKLPVTAVALGAGRIAIGTYLDGVVIASREGAVQAVVNHAAGLLDDHVEALWKDPQGWLWVGTNEGLSRFEADGAVSVFDPGNGLSDGTAKAVWSAGQATYIATGKTVYTVRPGASDGRGAELVAPADFQLGFRSGAAVGRVALAAGFGGIWTAGEDGPAWPTAWTQRHYVSADIFQLLPLRESPPLVLYTEQNNLAALDFTAKGWIPRSLHQSVGGTPVSMIQDSGGNVWVSAVDGEIHRFAFTAQGRSGNPSLRETARYLPGAGLPDDIGRPILSRVGRNVYALGQLDILRLDARAHFVAELSAAPYRGLGAATAGDAAYWLVRAKSLGDAGPVAVVRVTGGDSASLQPVDLGGLGSAARIAGINVTREAGRDILWLCGPAGAVRVEGAAGRHPEPAPAIGGVDTRADGKQPRSLLDLPAKTEKVGFSFAAPWRSDGAPVYYQTWLEGAESTWAAAGRTAERVYPGLPPGAYTFHVRTLNSWGAAGPETTVALRIAKPWYLWPAVLGAFASAALALIAAGARWRLRRFQRETERLNGIVAERTRELALANTAKTEFLETLSHEIRNPLNGIRGLVPMLAEMPLAPKQRELAASLASCAGALTRTFDQVLNFSKLESGEAKVERRPFNLPALLDEVIALHRVTARQRHSELRVAYGEARTAAAGSPRLLRLVGDAERIKTILGNLVGNALKYAPGTPVEITVDWTEVSARTLEVTIAVRDRGPGIPREEQELVFKKFVRGSKAKEDRVPGTGLGLATCRVLAEQMGGFVGVESEPGAGSTFFLQLRLRRDQAAGAADAAGPVHPAGTEAAPAGLRALVVEDHDYNQLVALRIAQRIGLEPEAAQDGQEALRKLAGAAYDVLFIDWDMPDMKGTEIARHVRTLGWGPEAIIVATTAHDSDANRAECLAAGMDAFVVKPFDEATMARTLDQIRTRRGQPLNGAAPSTGSGLNLRVFALVGNDDPIKTAQAAADYLSSMQQEIDHLDRAWKADAWSAAARAGHRLRAHAGLLGAEEMKNAARALQLEIESAPPERRSVLREALITQANALRAQIELMTGTGTELKGSPATG